MRRLAIVGLLLLAGCATRHKAIFSPLASPPSKAVIVQKQIALGWNCAPTTLAPSLLTGLERTTNFQTWDRVFEIPYQTNIVAVLTNQPPSAWYRAYWRFSP